MSISERPYAERLAAASKATARTPWYLAPEPLAILAAMDRKPAVEWSTQTYVLTSDRIATFTGEAFERLSAIWSDAFRKADHSDAARNALFEQGTAEDVIGALFGDCYGNAHFQTYRDESAKWAAIRANVQGALQKAAA